MFFIVKQLIRKSLLIRENETIRDGINRHVMKLRKYINNVFFKKYITINEFKDILINLGLQKGDVVIVHSAWRGCYNLNASPEEIIQAILDIIETSGTLLMPCYGVNNLFFDLKNTKSNAGVLSEVFRVKFNTMRSEFPDSAMCGIGNNAKNILSNHFKSEFAFDDNSPYYTAMNDYNAKIMLLGMGKLPYKISVFHCAAYKNKEINKFYKKVFSKLIKAKVIGNDGNEYEKEYLFKTDGYHNNNCIFKKLFKKVNKKSYTTNGFNVIIFNSRDAYNVANNYCKNGGKIYAK